MVKIFFVTVSLLMGFQCLETFSTKLFAQAPNTLWTRTYGGTNWDEGFSVQECAEGGFIIAGETEESFGNGKSDVYLVRTDAQGDTIWTRTYGGALSDVSRSVQECTGGGLIIAGKTNSFGAGYDDVYLIKTDAQGDTIWTKTYGGTLSDDGRSVQECAEGGFIIAGMTSSFGAGWGDVYLIRTDAEGDTIWTKTYGGTNYDWGESVQECTDSGFIIAGMTSSFGAGSWDVYLIKTDSDGDTLWTKTYGGISNDWGCSVKECTEEGFIIAGTTNSFGVGSSRDVYLIRTDTQGDTLWTKIYGRTGDDRSNSVQECAGSGFIIAGYTTSFGDGDGDIYLIRTNANGDTLWIKTYGRAGSDYGYSVQECASGGFIIAGYTSFFGPFDVYLIRTGQEVGIEEDRFFANVPTDRLEIYPNPFTQSTVISYHIPDIKTRYSVSLQIYDLTGQLVKTLLDSELSTINSQSFVAWDSKDEQGNKVAGGIYFIKLEAGKFKTTQKLIILR